MTDSQLVAYGFAWLIAIAGLGIILASIFDRRNRP